jgi:hypothetical protein
MALSNVYSLRDSEESGCSFQNVEIFSAHDAAFSLVAGE